MRIIALLVFSFLSLYAKSDRQMEIIECLYKSPNAQKIIEENGLTKRENIENLLYAEKHEKEYFLKAIVLDYLYGAKNIDIYYKKAFEKAKKEDKENIGMFYTLYLLKTGAHSEAIKFLRGYSIYGPISLDIPKKIAYIYEVFGLEKDKEVNAYLKLKHIDDYFIKGEVNGCSANK